jgi:hypothetical protein
MRSSEQINELATALAAAQKMYTPVKKAKTGLIEGVSRKTGKPYSYEYKYADLADVLQMALPALSANGLSFSQPNTLIDGKLRVVSRLMHSTGQWIESDGIEISEGGTPQEFGMESTYFRRYDGASLLGIAPDEDTDAVNIGPKSTQKLDAKPAQQHNADCKIDGDRMTVRVTAVEQKTGKKGDYLVVWPDGLVLDGIDRIFVYDDKLFPYLLGKAQNKTCGFKFDTRTVENAENGTKRTFARITDVLFVGEDVIEHPSTATVENLDADVPF